MNKMTLKVHVSVKNYTLKGIKYHKNTIKQPKMTQKYLNYTS